MVPIQYYIDNNNHWAVARQIQIYHINEIWLEVLVLKLMNTHVRLAFPRSMFIMRPEKDQELLINMKLEGVPK